MKKIQTIGFFLLSVIAIAALLQSCSKEESPYITSKFDPAFANVLQARGYIPDASCISAEDVACITELDISGTYVLTSLKGIEYFTSLKTLWCSSNQLTSLDVSNNPALVNLDCGYNQLTSLDVSNNPALVDLDCFSNQLTSLDVSNNPALESLYCADNQLTSLDVSSNPDLWYLQCYFNQLTSLDVSNNPALVDLDCADNQLTSLDVSSNPDLWILECHDNQLTSLDISNNKSLAYLRCYDNPGDGTKFNVAAWFSNNSIPSSYYQEFTTGTWSYNGNTISINYYIPE